jgi:hypothetical protein
MTEPRVQPGSQTPGLLRSVARAPPACPNPARRPVVRLAWLRPEPLRCTSTARPAPSSSDPLAAGVALFLCVLVADRLAPHLPLPPLFRPVHRLSRGHHLASLSTALHCRRPHQQSPCSLSFGNARISDSVPSLPMSVRPPVAFRGRRRVGSKLTPALTSPLHRRVRRDLRSLTTAPCTTPRLLHLRKRTTCKLASPARPPSSCRRPRPSSTQTSPRRRLQASTATASRRRLRCPVSARRRRTSSPKASRRSTCTRSSTRRSAPSSRRT